MSTIAPPANADQIKIESALKKTELGYQEAVSKGLVFDYHGGTHSPLEEK